MRISIVFLLSFFLLTEMYSQGKPAYKIYTTKGREVSYKKMVKTLSKSDVVLFGEFHNNPIIHWLEYEVAVDLNTKRKLILGAEMFEKDNQLEVNRYLNHEITEKALDTLVRLWSNYHTDYKPLLDFSKKNKLPFIATNIPRKYASQVYREGLESLLELSNEEKKWIAPLPIKYDATLPGYVKIKSMMGGHGGDNLPKAQAIKDATMANSILMNSKKGSLFLHFNGSYHSDNFEGIYWYLKQSKPTLAIKTISTVEQNNIRKLSKENKDNADFIIVIPENMTKTF